MKKQFLAALLALALSTVWAQAQEPAAIVNGEPIDKAALVERLLEHSTLGRQMLDQMIGEALLEQEAKKKGITVTDQDAQARIEQMRKDQSEEEFARYLVENHLREKGLARAVRTKLLAERLFGSEVTVTDEEAQNFYDANKSLFTVPPMAQVRVMLLATEEEATAILQRAAKGESFEALVREKSRHVPTRVAGGLIGPAPREALAKLFPGAGEAAFTTEVGAVSQLIRRDDGWWLVKVEARSAGSIRAFEEAKELIRRDLTDARLNQAYRAWLLQTLQDPATKIEPKL